ncbi:hypothetical protein LINPERPRIM_LOCUS23723 [Linum perenne]
MSIVYQSSSRRRSGGSGFISKLCYAIDILLSIDPPPFRLLVILAALCFILLPGPWLAFSSKHTAAYAGSAVGMTGIGGAWVLPATPITLIILLQWFSGRSNMSARAGWLMPQRISSEGISPWVVTAIIVQVVVMVRYRPSFQDNSLCPNL